MLSLADAVHEIIDATKPRPWQPPAPVSRFFFIVGAGISYPAIPLAAGIEELCRKEIERKGRTPSAMSKPPIERYETHFQEAFPQSEDRRAFLHHHIKSAPISAANFRLAHLVGSRQITNLVVTTNFDELFTKALRLFGEDVIVCDHSHTTQRIDPRRDDFQVIHVHGTHWFYDCCNLKDEIESRAQADREGNTSMSHLLDRVLHDRSPLVVGYSGWEGDVVMAALKRRLKTPLGSNLYWFCFRRADVDALPPWLKEHANVRFVVPPPAPPEEKGGGTGAMPNIAGEAMRAGPIPVDAASGSRPQEPVQSARQVFDALIRGLSLEEPALTKAPLEFFAAQLQKNLIAPDVSDEDDVYLIRQVIRHVEEGAEMTRQAREKRSQKEKENAVLLDHVSKAVRSAAYTEVFEAAREIDLRILSDVQRVDLEAALEALYLNAHTLEAKTWLDACEMRIRLCEQAQASGGKDPDWLLREAKARHGQGYCLAIMGRQEEAIAAYDEVLRRFGDSSESALKEPVAKALVNKGAVLGDSGKQEEAIAAYDEVLRRFGDSSESALKESVSRALFNKGVALGKGGKQEEAIAAYDEVLRRFGDSSESALKETVARALVNKGGGLVRRGKQEEAIAAYDEVLRRFGDSSESALKEPVAKALVNKGAVLGDSGKQEEAIAAYDEVLRRFGDSSEAVLKEHVAWALVNKGSALGKGGKQEEAVAACDEVLRRFGNSSESALKDQVARASSVKALYARDTKN